MRGRCAQPVIEHTARVVSACDVLKLMIKLKHRLQVNLWRTVARASE
jgi:hypothetical protein